MNSAGFAAVAGAAAAALAVGAVAAPGVAESAHVSLATSAQVVQFGDTVILSGRVAAARRGQTVDLVDQACGFTAPVPLATVHTKADGTFRFSLEPMLATRFRAESNGVQSSFVAVRVRPQLSLARLPGSRYQVSASVGGGQFFTGKHAFLQSGDGKHWSTIADVTLKAASDPTNLVAVSSGTARARVPHGASVRAVMPQSQVGRCYAPAVTPPSTP